MDPTPEPPPVRTSDRHLWQIRWVRDLVIIAVVLIVLDIGYEARAITIPALMGLALAYAFNPLVTWARRRGRVPRQVTTALIIILLTAAVAALLAYLGPLLVDQATHFFGKLDDYARNASRHVAHWIDVLQSRARETNGEPPATRPTDASRLWEAATQPGSPAGKLPFEASQVMAFLTRWFNLGVSLLISTFGVATYIVLAFVVGAFSFFMFSWKFEGVVHWLGQFIPASNRGLILGIIAKMDRSVSGFIRGRLIQSVILGTVLTIGWAVADVPFWLLLGIVAMCLNLIPYAAIITWPLAMFLTWVDRTSGGLPFDPWYVFVWPSGVYFVAQSIDGWVVEPLVQGKATNLHPLAILLAVLIGGTLGGIFGMMLAIPIAACLKILMQEIIVPKVKAWAETT
jgi:predicted PurR-regulated permease PerM